MAEAGHKPRKRRHSEAAGTAPEGLSPAMQNLALVGYFGLFLAIGALVYAFS
jgi:hypothetical protein